MSDADGANGQTTNWAPPGGVTPPPVAPPMLPLVATVAGPPSSSDAGLPPTPPLAPGGEVTFDEPEPQGRKSRLAVAGLAVGVVALGAAGVFAVAQLRGGNTGGAESPEAVGASMMAALEQEDMLGMVDLLLPGERDTFRQPMIDMVSELTRLEVVSSDASLADLSGLDIEMTNQLTEVTPTNVADISNIMMTAQITASLDGDQLPIGDLITDIAGDQFDPSEFDEAATTTDFELPMTVVEEAGRWYLSLFHTAAEAVRGSTGEPIPETGLAPRGGDTPEGAVAALLDGVEQFDVGKIIASINPNEARALQRYAPLFLDDIDPLLDDIPFTWQVTQTEFEVEGSGSERFVTVTALRIDGDAEGEPFSLAISGRCAVVEAGGEQFDSCELTQGQPSLDELLGESSESVTELSAEFASVFADYNAPGITVQEIDGTWYVSPIAAGIDQVLAIMRALDREKLDQLIDATQTVFDEVFEDLAGGLPLFLDDITPDGDSGFDDFTLDDDGGFGEFDSNDDSLEPDPAVEQELDEFNSQQRIVTECYSLGDAATVVACIRENIASGALPEYFLAPELEYPECGLSEFSLGTATLSDLSDAEFTSIMQTASVCFGELIAAGTLTEFDVPSEYLRPECAEGRNPWDFSRADSNEFFDTFLDCVYG
ncbi:MAG: hypothetical protein ACI9N0_003637 [Ilumatobacter sp.]|jgi:hypothetical protein